MSSKRSTDRKTILVVSLARHLTGFPVKKATKADWEKEKARNIADSFDSVGFNLDPKDTPSALKALRHELEGRSRDSIILGWCIRDT
jgi:hypothetical protein